jgi:hypothetical protein
MEPCSRGGSLAAASRNSYRGRITRTRATAHIEREIFNSFVVALVLRPCVARTEESTMPSGRHLRGVSAKEQRQYEHIKAAAQRSGRYGPRAKEVAARTVMKQHKAKGHRRGK